MICLFMALVNVKFFEERMIKRLLAFLPIILLMGCYLPNNFELNMQLSKSGKYAMEYDGTLTHLGFLQRIGRGELNEAEVKENVAKFETDLRRDSAFSKVDYEDQARYAVKYSYQGNIHKRKLHSFVQRNGWFMSIRKSKPGVVEIKGNKLPKQYIDELIASGFDSYGTVRVWTDAKVGFHNAQNVVEGDLTLYEWFIESMRDPSPSMVIAIE